jgi:hypothetical protein
MALIIETRTWHRADGSTAVFKVMRKPRYALYEVLTPKDAAAPPACRGESGLASKSAWGQRAGQVEKCKFVMGITNWKLDSGHTNAINHASTVTGREECHAEDDFDGHCAYVSGNDGTTKWSYGSGR